MARPLRIEYPGAWYHVTSRGNERAAIFRDDFDRHVFIKILRESLEAFAVEVHGFVLMANHYHLLLKTLLGNLCRFMQRFNTAYTVYFNKRHDRPGHLFQGRYKAILIDADSYLLELSRYVHLNPVRTARFKERPIEEKVSFLDSYRWSSFRRYVGEDRQNEFVRLDVVLGAFGRRVKEAQRRYREFVLQGLTEELPTPLKEKEGQMVLGPPSFVEWVYRTFIDGRESDKEYSRLREALPAIPVERIVEAVADEFGVPVDRIVKRGSHATIPRQMMMELSCRLAIKDCSLKEIGGKLGGISVSGLGKSRARFAARMGKDPRLSKRFEKVKEKLICLSG